MTIESGGKDVVSESGKGFFDSISEWWKSLMDFVKEKISALKDTLIDLNILKRDVVSDWWGNNKNTGSDVVRESVEVDNKALKEKLKQICVRSREHWDVAKNDEWYVSFWSLQFHWPKAKEVLRNIKSRNPSRFNSIMTDELFRNTDAACMSIRDNTQVGQFRELMKDPWAQQEMDKVTDETINGYISMVHWWWVSDPRATLAFWRICNYWPDFARGIKEEMTRKGLDFNDYNKVIDYYEQTPKWRIHKKFQKPDKALWYKNIREFIGDCWA